MAPAILAALRPWQASAKASLLLATLAGTFVGGFRSGYLSGWTAGYGDIERTYEEAYRNGYHNGHRDAPGVAQTDVSAADASTLATDPDNERFYQRSGTATHFCKTHVGALAKHERPTTCKG